MYLKIFSFLYKIIIFLIKSPRVRIIITNNNVINFLMFFIQADGLN